MGWWARLRGRELRERAQPPAEEGGALRNGKKHGVWIEKGQEGWKSGFLESIYRDGVKHGPYRFWHGAGFVHERGMFVDGAKEGEASFFDKDGRRFAISTWRAGKWHGAYREYDDAGAVKLEREYRDGTIYSGPYELKAHDDGTWIWRKAFKDGHPIGLFEEYRHGKVTLHANYDDDGALHGAWRDHHDHYAGGGVKLEGTYARGERTGVWQWHRKDGAVVARCDYDGDRAWTTADGTRLDVRDGDGDDFARWIGLAEAIGTHRIEQAIDAWPEDDRERAVAWTETKLGPHTITVGIGSWLGALIDRDGDPRCRLIGGISTDHGSFRAEHLGRMVRHAHAMRVLSFYEEDLQPGAEALFPPGVAWPKLERLLIQECGPLGALPRRLAEAPWARAITHLTLDDDTGGISDADAAALIASPHLAAVRDLLLGPITEGPALARAIATAPMLANVEELELHHPSDVLAVLAALAARDTPALRRLEIRGEGDVPRATIIGLVAKSRHPKLEKLTFEDFEVPDGIAVELTRRWPHVRVSF